MKIVVIGATGTIGKSVSKKLKENNHEVIEVGSKSGDYQLDITSPTEIEQMYKDIKDILRLDKIKSDTYEHIIFILDKIKQDYRIPQDSLHIKDLIKTRTITSTEEILEDFDF